jgi:hypothetical protein
MFELNSQEVGKSDFCTRILALRRRVQAVTFGLLHRILAARSGLASSYEKRRAKIPAESRLTQSRPAPPPGKIGAARSAF